MAKELKNLLVNQIHDRALRAAASDYFSGRLLDIGCGTKPYADLVHPYVEEHIGLDHHGMRVDSHNVDIFGTAYDIPVEDESFDCALSTAVLEHLEEPEEAMRECYRILRPGGVVIYTVPLIWHIHEAPRDFFRYTKYGLEYLLSKKVGFEIVRLEALSGFWVTFSQLLVYNLDRFNRGLIKRSRLLDTVELGIQGAGYVLDRLDRTEQWTWMYLVVARKPVVLNRD